MSGAERTGSAMATLPIQALWKLAMRMLARDWRAGEQRLLALSLVIAVASVTTVAFFADRVARSLVSEAGQLLGADLVIVSDKPIDARLAREAQRLGLASTSAVRFPSMAQSGDKTLLVEVKAIEHGYPLRGRLLVRNAVTGPDFTPHEPSAPGEVWIDDRLMRRMGLNIGDRIGLGEREFRVASQLSEEPESSAGFFNLGPRLMMNAADLESTGLIQTGSRVTYRLFVAGSAATVATFRDFATQAIGAGQRVEDVRDARPEIKSALERAERFLGLAALMTVLLAGVAVALAARRYLQRHLDACAVMRCLGASQNTILAIHVMQFLTIGLLAGLAGCAVGFACQYVLAVVLAPVVSVTLPAPGLRPALQGMATGMVMLLGFALPPLVALKKVPALRVLRRDLGAPDSVGVSAYVLATIAIAALVLWQAGELKLGLYVLGGIAGTALACGLLTALAIRLLGRAGRGRGLNWRFGIANLRRHRAGSIVQVMALALGLMALILLSLVRANLLADWRKSLPADAPNSFLVNIQPSEVHEVERFFTDRGVAMPHLFPMVRGRLVAINGKPVSSRDYTDDRARRLVDREFNLSWTESLQPGNTVVEGRWFDSGDTGKPVLSLEEGLAKTLNLKFGDNLTYDIAGSQITTRVTSMRKVDWDSFRVNFFAVTPPGVLEKFPASYVTSLHLAPQQAAMVDELVKRFPNMLVIDVAAILAQVQRTMDQVIQAVEFVFLFSVVAGVLVLFAAIGSTHDERQFDAAVMRTLGASARQLRAVQAAEFALIGSLAGLFAAFGATAIGYFIAERVLNLPYTFDPWVWVTGTLVGAAGVTIAGLVGTAGVLRTPPMQVFRASS